MYRPNRDEMNYSEGKIYRRSLWRRHKWQIIAIGSLLLTLVFAFTTILLAVNRSNGTAITAPAIADTRQTNATSLTTTQITPTQAIGSIPLPPTGGSLPCIVNVGTWTAGSSAWKVLNGVLLNDGSQRWDYNSGPTIVAPCQLGTIANYAVETKIQVVSSQSDPCFGITVRGNPLSSGWQGYKAGLGNCGSLGSAQISGPDYFYDSQIKKASFDPGNTVHTYRVEVSGNIIKFLIDGGLILDMTDNRYLTGSEVGLWSQDTQLEVSSFQVTAL